MTDYIKVQNGVAIREAVPANLMGLLPGSLSDLSWTDPAINLRDCAWWPAEEIEQEIGASQRFGEEVLEPDTARKVVIVRRHVIDLAPEEMAESIAEAKTIKNALISAWRIQASQSVFPHAGKSVACDGRARSDIDGVANHIALFGTFPDGFPNYWKATDNTMIPLPDIDAFRAMYASMTAQGTKNFNHAQELKAKLAAASTPEEIAAIVW